MNLQVTDSFFIKQQRWMILEVDNVNTTRHKKMIELSTKVSYMYYGIRITAMITSIITVTFYILQAQNTNQRMASLHQSTKFTFMTSDF